MFSRVGGVEVFEEPSMLFSRSTETGKLCRFKYAEA